MLDEALSVVSIWTSVNSWLTPSVLFVVLNLVIGTIAFTSGLSSSAPKTHSSPSNPHAPQPLPRSPSVLHRIRSIKLYRSEPPSSDSVLYRPAEHSIPDPVTDPAPILSKVENAVHEESLTARQEEDGVEEEPEGLEGPTMDQVFSQIQQAGGVYVRSKSDGGYTAAPKKVQRRIVQKAASDISSTFGQFQQPMSDSMAFAEHEDEFHDGEEVDGKAEDFINRFRQQLNMQRMDSIYGATA